MSGAEIEKQLTLAHKIASAVASRINFMLTTRRLNMTTIAEAADNARNAADHMQRLVALLRGE